jgi:hypothetical protein
LLHNEKSYCGYKGGEIYFLREKLKKAKKMLENCLRERDECRAFFEEERAAGLENLRVQQQHELMELEEEFSKPPPQKYQHRSGSLLQIQKQQTICITEKLERKWLSMIPEKLKREKHWREVIEHIKKQLRREREDSREVRAVTRGMLRSCTERGLPKLGSTVRTSPMTRVTTVNNQRNYTRNIRTRSSMR